MAPLLDKLKALLGSGGGSSGVQQPKDETPSPYPPAVIDFKNFKAAGPSDERSPCPVMNALCNHQILPHNGKNITKEMAVTALTRVLNMDDFTAAVLSSHAVNMNPDKTAHFFDLNHLDAHGDVEHDCSLSRNDAAFGDNHTFDPAIWDAVMATYGQDEMTSFDSASKARWDRVMASKKAHKDAGKIDQWQYGIKELLFSYGETSFLMNFFGDPEHGKIPVQYLKIIFEQARLPYDEGWRKPQKPIGQKEIFQVIVHLIAANKEKHVEARLAGMETVQVVQNAISSMMPTHCTVM